MRACMFRSLHIYIVKFMCQFQMTGVNMKVDKIKEKMRSKFNQHAPDAFASAFHIMDMCDEQSRG